MIEMLSAETETWKNTAEETINDQIKQDEETYNALKTAWLEKGSWPWGVHVFRRIYCTTGVMAPGLEGML